MPEWFWIFLGSIILIILLYVLYKLWNKQNEQENHSQEFNQISDKNGLGNSYLEDIEIGYMSNQRSKDQNQGFGKEENQFNSLSQISNRNSNIQKYPLNSQIQAARFKADEERNQKVQKIIKFIYAQSQGKRKVEEKYQYFLGEYYQQQELWQEYNIKKLDQKQKMKQLCTAYRAVRGDGNCFYTAFGFQFLEILLLKYTKDQFYQFLNANQVNFQIRLNDKDLIDEGDQQKLRDEFFFRLERLKLIEDIELRKQTLQQEFKAYEKENEKIDGCFYGLSTIFFRNLAQKVVDLDEIASNTFGTQNLLLWETECNENEIVIAAFAKYLKMQFQQENVLDTFN
ncbi:unnamed protein product (macronuclear) [Paramecium tetraurelia]|uniref:ubiquitinyl hydrolase 1 n=1 Tax=Paramecium tetraurelia TaxID=5888 RepID=A0BR67_PARTE|nr:uncharacterized protein GSPATT00031264001 [Paramecium tetraurelia]CAK61034.1 unnamed protein product [Paramecium tetraurelia]|eukprot:XP_001428432.1 hypothetical protein (macronuclear) [Paramecium tetraurelia strain d4-2]